MLDGPEQYQRWVDQAGIVGACEEYEQLWLQRLAEVRSRGDVESTMGWERM